MSSLIEIRARVVKEDHPIGTDAVYINDRCIARGNWVDMTTLRDQINLALDVKAEAERHTRRRRR